ncbi:hypothetical protein JOM56_009156 [Amanita muscaria]
MSDAFSDLWSSSAPSKPAAPKTLGGSTLTPSTRKTQDAFSLLSSGNTPKPSFNAPLNSNTTQSRANLISQTKPKSINGNDAFGDLLGGSMASTSSSSRMTIAERAADAERQRLAALQKRQQLANSEASAWAGLDSLAGPSFTPPTQTQTALKSTLSNDDWGFGAESQPIQPAILTRPSNDEDDWGLGDLASSASTRTASSKPQTSNASKSRTLWDLDDFISSSSATPEGDVLLHDQSHSLNDDDDILGDLGKPIDSVSRTPPTGARKSSPLHQNSTGNQPSGSRPVGPPPHVIGQLVEMGFSVQQARVALAATDTGLDVQVALETLLSNTTASDPLPPTSRHQSPGPALPRGHRDRVQKSSITSSVQQDNEEREANLQEQADKLLAQASEIGLNMFNKASIFWREGKERAKKAYEERAAAGSVVGGIKKPPSTFSGRPKWMTDNPNEDADGDEWGPKLKDAVDGTAAPPKPGVTRNVNRLDSQADVTQPTPVQTKAAETDLLSNEPQFYISPWRRGKPISRVDDSTRSSSQSATPRPPSPIKAVPRANVIAASEPAISLSTHHKVLGAEKFKLGQYSEAEAAYSSAITALPDSHLSLVPLYNNRALTRLKIGDYAGVIEDTSGVIRIIGSGYHPARELKVSREEEGSNVDLADGLIKALKRRAEAFEGREKWDESRKDWEAIAAKEWARPNTRSEAVRGAGRCKGMTRPSSSSSTPPVNGASKLRPAAIPPRLRSVRPSPTARPSEALTRLRSANDAADAEDQTRYELKDSVDAKILAWKAGKETNIRALLASLEAVLWPELGLQKVGMAELVSPSQVKIRYTKTIAKLHPDKLNPSNSTIEQRMLANGVFGTLNDAWNAFK